MNKHDRQEYKAVLKRDNFTCKLCSKPYAHIHHVQYKSLGGANIRENLMLLCVKCHEAVHSDSDYWKPILLDRLRLHYGNLEIEDLKKKGKYENFKYNK